VIFAIWLRTFRAYDATGNITNVTWDSSKTLNSYGQEYSGFDNSETNFAYTGKKKESHELLRFDRRMYNMAGLQWTAYDPAVRRTPEMLIENINPRASIHSTRSRTHISTSLQKRTFRYHIQPVSQFPEVCERLHQESYQSEEERNDSTEQQGRYRS